MKRRPVIESLASGLSMLAGCSSVRSISNFEQTATVSKAQSLRWHGKLLHGATKNHPARIKLTLENTGKDSIKIGFGPTPPFSNPRENEEEGENLIFYHPEMGPHTAPKRRINSCWKIEKSETIATYSVLNEEILEPNSKINNEYAIYNSWENSICYPDGRHVFKDSILLAENEDGEELLLTVTIKVRNNSVTSVMTSNQNLHAQ